MSNLILGIIKDYGRSDIKPFLSSLKKSGYRGETILFINNINEQTQKWLTDNGIKLIPYKDQYPYLSEGYQKDMGILPKDFQRKLHLFSTRYLLYYLYLKNNPGKYDYVMLTDVRDVIFQKDPFDFAINGNFCSFLEASEWPIFRSDFNAVEIETVFGKEALNKIGHNLISCAGTSIGPTESMVKYLEKMIKFILEKGDIMVIDQGTHNYILWNNLIAGVNIKHYKNNEGPILTLGYEKKIFKNNEGEVTDKYGIVPNVIHQYDRHFFLAMSYYDLYGKMKFTNRWAKRLGKKANDYFSAVVKSRSPGLHHSIKKIKKTIS